MPVIQPKLHTNKELSDGTYSVKLYIYDDIEEKTYWYPLGMRSTKKQWNADSNSFRKNYPSYKKKNLILKRFELKANEIYDSYTLRGEWFDFEQFKIKMGREKQKNVTVLDFYNQIINEHAEQAKTSTSKASSGKVWKDTRNLLIRFIQYSKRSKGINFRQLDAKFLFELEAYMRGNGNKDNTISLRMRNIKRAWNLVKNQELVDAKLYPFGASRYQLGKQVKTKSDKPNPLDAEQLDKWKNLRLEGFDETVRKLCLLSYYLNGSNFIDLVQLKKKENLSNGRIVFHRSKTGCLITIKITNEIEELLKDLEGNGKFLLSILNDSHETGQQIKNRATKFNKKANLTIKKIAVMVGKDPTEFSFYNFRDTFANRLKESGVDIQVISSLLGHKDIGTTIGYLKKFGVQKLDDVSIFL